MAVNEPFLGTIPNFWVDVVEPLRSFYMDKLGFGSVMGVVGSDGKLDFAIVQYETLQAMIGRPAADQAGMKGTAPDGERTVDVYYYLKDVDAFYAEIQKRRVPIVKPIADEWWGDRVFTLKDPYGYTLHFCQSGTNFNPPPGLKVI